LKIILSDLLSSEDTSHPPQSVTALHIKPLNTKMSPRGLKL